MDIKTLKSEIYRKLELLDEEQLQVVSEMVTAYQKQTNKEEGEWDALSDENKAAIEEGVSQIEKGEFYSFEEVRVRIHKTFFDLNEAIYYHHIASCIKRVRRNSSIHYR